MNNPSQATPESSFNSRAVASAATSPTHPFYWSVRRELWENRYVYLVPVGVAAIFLVGNLVGMIHLPSQMRQWAVMRHFASDPKSHRDALLMPYHIAAAFMMSTYILVTLFYCADALHGERRDRSILFWKSLPVSDATVVLAKASIPFIILPLLTFAVILVLQFMILLLSSAVLMANNLSVADLWTHLPVMHMSFLLLYHIITSHALWPAPIYCWMLLVSGWARRAAFLWAALPVLVIAGVEEMAFHTHRFATLVGNRLIGETQVVSFTPPSVFPTDPMVHIAPTQFLLSPSLWIGLAIAAAFLAAAVRLRRIQGPV
jgi:ABC-2 type transport system permease protein